MHAAFRWWKAFATWLLVLALAFANGAAREGLLIPAFGRAAGLLASGILLSSLIVVVALASIRWIGTSGSAEALRVGIFWLLATLAFEFGFGGLVQGKPMAGMLAAYTFQGGNIWPAVLLVTLLAPLLAHRLRGRRFPHGRPA